MSNKTQRRQLTLAALFLGIYSVALTLSPAVTARSWDVDLRWGHWIGYAVWVTGLIVAHRETCRRLPERDPFLLPITALLSGWGLLTIWRLTPHFGLRQTVWLGVALGVFVLGLRLPSDLNFLRRYKYLWLTSGLTLTALTLIFGTNPMGFGPRLWLGCCGVYLQPSEPLKLLLVIYLAAYGSTTLADYHSLPTPPSTSHALRSLAPRLHILIPTLIMTGLALLLLLVQRDLGTASIFIFLYSVMIYLAGGWRLIPLISAAGLALAGAAGYQLFDVVRLRIDAWINPWLDPSGRSYQIVQSLIAVANGGVFGRGPGLGSPSVVPVAHSDFVFAAIAEETGLVGSLGLLLLIGLLTHRGLRAALHAPDSFRRYLSAGLTAHLVAQSILIIGGNLRLLPLTGVTLPFMSYGGSSLLISFIALLLLLHISTSTADHRPPTAIRSTLHAPLLPRSPAPLLPASPRPPLPAPPSTISNLSTLLILAIIAASLTTGWWAFHRGPNLLTRTDNPRRAIADRFVHRGSLLDRHNSSLAESTGQAGSYIRQVSYPSLGPILGYTHPVYGQSGLEASLDPYLRGIQGNDPLTIWCHHLLYGQPPPGLDVRLTLDLELQLLADELLGGHSGALILLNAENGEILVMASHPTFDPDRLDDNWDDLIQDDSSPLLNRVTQGSYPTGGLGAILFPDGIAAPEPNAVPQLRLPGGESPPEGTPASPLQIALAAAPLSSGGLRPEARIAQAVNIPEEGWVLLPTLDDPAEILHPLQAQSCAQSLGDAETHTWHTALIPSGETLTWYIGGTLPDWNDTPLVLVFALEENNLPLAEEIGAAVLWKAMGR